MEDSPWASALALAGGFLQATARHQTSACAIDGIWSSDHCRRVGAQEVPSASDHSIAECTFNTSIPKSLPEWRLSKTPRMVDSEVPPSDVAWDSIACSDSTWVSALGDLEGPGKSGLKTRKPGSAGVLPFLMTSPKGPWVPPPRFVVVTTLFPVSKASLKDS